MKDHIMDLWDTKGIVALLINGIFAMIAWTWRYSAINFGSLASEFVAKEILPWVTLIAVVTTTVLAFLNYYEKRQARRSRLTEEPTDSP